MDEEIWEKVWVIWIVMDNSIKEGVWFNDEVLLGSLKFNWRVFVFYCWLICGLYFLYVLEGLLM